MQHCEFTLEEWETLREVMEHALNELDIEISRTDRLDFKELLKHRRETMGQIFAKLAAAPVIA